MRLRFISENLHNTVLGRYAEGESSAVVNHNRYLSRSAQNLSVGDAGGDNSFQSLPVKRGAYIKNNSRSKLGYHTLKHNSEIVITIDIGTTFSGFAYSIDGVTSGNVHTMKSIKGIHRKGKRSLGDCPFVIAVIFTAKTNSLTRIRFRRSSHEEATNHTVAEFENRVSLIRLRRERLLLEY